MQLCLPNPAAAPVAVYKTGAMAPPFEYTDSQAVVTSGPRVTLEARNIGAAIQEANAAVKAAGASAVAQGVFLNEAARTYEMAPLAVLDAATGAKPFTVDHHEYGMRIGAMTGIDRTDASLAAIVGHQIYYSFSQGNDVEVGAQFVADLTKVGPAAA